MKFEEARAAWSERWPTHADAARLLGVSERMFRQQMDRYDPYGLGAQDVLIDKRPTGRTRYSSA